MTNQDIFEEPDQPFTEHELTNHPLELFGRWYEAAVDAQPGPWLMSHAMTLATSDSEGYVTARTVLMKSILPDGVLFFSNYNSQKGKQLHDNPRAAAVFHWPHCFRQVRLEGKIMRTSAEVSEDYFHSRPRGSQISAFVSSQSQPVESREELVRMSEEVAQQYRGEPIPLPENWGGYALVAEVIEFWQSRKDRLHDRFQYRLNESTSTNDPTRSWRWLRLAP